MSNKLRNIQYIIFVGILFSLISFIPGVPSYVVMAVANATVFAIAALGFNVLMGYSGLISLGHAGFMGLGAYLSAILAQMLGWHFFFAIAAAVVVTFLIGLFMGLIALRLQDMYLAVATLGLGEIFIKVFNNLKRFTGGDSGTIAVKKAVTDAKGVGTLRPIDIFGLYKLEKGEPWTIFGIKVHEPFVNNAEINTLVRTQMLVILLVVLVILMILVNNFIKSSTGRALIAMKNSESAARAMGINLYRYKLMSFSLSAAMAGLAGSFYIYLIGNTTPHDWTMALSLNLVVAIVVGGAGTISGAFIGSLIVKVLSEVISSVPVVGELPGVTSLVYGVLLIIVLLFYPRGLAYFFDKCFNTVAGWLGFGKKKPVAASKGGNA